jgi:hypothetical protein
MLFYRHQITSVKYFSRSCVFAILYSHVSLNSGVFMYDLASEYSESISISISFSKSLSFDVSDSMILIRLVRSITSSENDVSFIF